MASSLRSIQATDYKTFMFLFFLFVYVCVCVCVCVCVVGDRYNFKNI